jgi:hypothetical protein
MLFIALDERFFFSFFFSGSPTTTGRVSESTLVRGSPASVYSWEHSYSTVVIHWHMYDILAPRANGPDLQTCRYSVLSSCSCQPCPPLLSVHSVGAHVPLSKDGVAFRLTVAWNRDLRPKLKRHLKPRIPRAFSPKSITSRITSQAVRERSNREAVKHVKRQTRGAYVYVHILYIREYFPLR